MKSLLGMHSKEFVGIDCSGSILKLVHLRTAANRIEVVNLNSRPIIGLSEEEIAKILKTIYNEFNARSPVIIPIVPANLAITKNIEIPSISPAEIREIVNLQAGRHTPYSRDEIIVDFVDIGVYKYTYTKILLIIVARSVIRRQFEILEKAGLKSEQVFFSPEGIASSCAKTLKLDTQGAPLCVIHIDEGTSDFMVVNNGKAIFVRSIPIGTRQLTEEREKFGRRFADEIKSSLESYQSEDIERNPNSVALLGAVEGLNSLTPLLTETLHIPVKIVSYARSILISNDAFNKAALAKGMSFFSLIAPILAHQEMKINLIPEEIKLRLALQERGRELIKTGILVLTNFVLIFAILISKIYFASTYLKRLDLKYQPISKEAVNLEKDFSKVGQLKSYLAKRGFSLEVLTELYGLTPPEIQLNDIRFDDQGRFVIRGTADSMSVVFSFVEDMEKSKYFKDVHTKYTTKRKEGLRDVTDFEIESVLEKKVD